MRKTEKQILAMLDNADKKAKEKGHIFMADRSPESIKFWQDLDEALQKIIYSLPEKGTE